MRYVIFFAVIFCAAFAFADEAAPRTDGIQPALVESAKDPDPVVRQAAAMKLGETGNKSAVSILSGMVLGDPDESVRVAALGALVIIGDRGAGAAYVAALRDASDKVRRSAADALSGSWDEGSMNALIDALKNDPSPKVRQRVAESLGNPGIMGRAQAHHWDSSADTEVALIQALKKDESYEVRATAASMLGKFKSGKSIEPLLAAMEDKSSSVRAAAADALGSYDRPEVIERLIDAIWFEKEEQVIVNALRSVKYYTDPRLTGPVIQALRSGSQKVRWQAIDVLETQKPRDCLEPLKQMADDKYESDGVRVKAREALDMMGN